MGGFVSALGELAEKGLGKITDKLAGSKVGGEVMNLAGDKAAEFTRSPQGQIAGKLLDQFKSEQAKSLQGLDNTHSTLYKGLQSDPALRNKFDLKLTKLQIITNHLQGAGHPLTSVAKRLEAQTPDNFQKTLPEIAQVNLGQARLAGIANSFGDKMQNLVPLIMDLQDHSDPRMNVHGNRILDIVSNELKDTTKVPDPKSGAMMEASQTKVDVTRALRSVNKFRQASIAAGNKGTKLLSPESISLKPTYTAPNSIEKAVGGWIRTVQVPLVAIPHIGNYFNLGSSPLKSIGAALLTMGDKQLQDTVYASGALSATMHDIMHASLEGRTGKIAQWSQSPTAGELIYKGLHSPGFNYLRSKQLMMGGAVGYHSAITWAAEAVQGNKRAILELQEMGLDVNKIVNRSGQLTPEELQTGIFHFVNNRFFVNRTQDSGLYSNKNVFMRSATMYHQFLNAQVSFMRREAVKMLKAGDVMGLAQFAGSLGVLFPAIAPMLKSLEILGRTGNINTATQNAKDEYSNLSGSNGAGAASSEYLDLLFHIGGMGVFMNYMGSAQNHRLQAAALGPLFSTPLTAVEDAISGTKEALKDHKSNKELQPFRPLERDLLQDTLPVIGKPLSHWLAPTNKEEPKVKLSRRGRRRF